MLQFLSAIGPRMNSLFRPGGRIFYGWYIVIAATGIQWLAAMTWMHSYGAYTTLLRDEFGWSMTTLSWAFALTRMESGLLGPIQGYWVDRYGPRRILTIGTLIFGIGFFVFAMVDSIPTFFFAFILIALGSSLGGWATLMVSIVNWFDKHRSMAVAWSQIGFSLGGLSVPLVTAGLVTFGWRTMAVVSGVGILIIAGLLVQIVRHRPDEKGEVPDGIPKQETADGKPHPEPLSMTWAQARREPSFWLVSGGHAFSLLTVSSLLMHLIPHLTTSMNYSLVNAAFVFGCMTATQLVGLFLGGYLGDRFDKRILCVVCMFGHFIGLLAVTYATNVAWLVLFVLAHGLGWGIRGPLMVALRADYFGPKSFGTIMGFSSLIVMIGMTTGPIFCGWLFDLDGNYQRAFTIMAFASLLGSICFWAARPPRMIAAHKARV